MSLQTEDKNAVSIKSLLLSLIFHASIILVIISINNSSIPTGKLIVVDLTIEDAGSAAKDNSPGSESNPKNRSGVRTRNPEVKSQQSEIRKETVESKESKMEPVPLPARNIESVATTETQVPSVTYADKTLGDMNRGITIQDGEDISTKNQRGTVDGSFAEGGGIGVMGTGMKGVSGGGSGKANYGGKNRYLKENFAYIRDLIQKNADYPKLARQMGWEGKVIVSFLIFSDGNTKNIRIKQSSGIEVLDQRSIEAVKKASPFPKPPAEAQIIIPISYKFH